MKILLGLVLLTIGFEVAKGGKLLKKLNKQLGFKLQKIVVDNSANIESNAADLEASEANILDIKADISTNVDDISKNDAAISNNTASISNQDGRINTLINTHQTDINNLYGLHNDNAAAISSNGDEIRNITIELEIVTRCTATNWVTDCCTSANPCGLNQGDCDTNDHSTCSGDLKCGFNSCIDFCANTSALCFGQPVDCCILEGINDNTANIASNAAEISSVASGIADNAANIASNSAAISSNDADISSVTSGIADNAANIASNAADISSVESGIANNAAKIADPCFSDYNYNILSDPKRNRDHWGSAATPYCDNNISGDWKGEGWYRFVGPAGTQMADSYVPGGHCGSAASGWVNGAHPTTTTSDVVRNVCFGYSGNFCWGGHSDPNSNVWHTDVEIKLCSGGFYLYKLKNVPGCNLKYCGQD